MGAPAVAGRLPPLPAGFELADDATAARPPLPPGFLLEEQIAPEQPDERGLLRRGMDAVASVAHAFREPVDIATQFYAGQPLTAEAPASSGQQGIEAIYPAAPDSGPDFMPAGGFVPGGIAVEPLVQALAAAGVTGPRDVMRGASRAIGRTVLDAATDPLMAIMGVGGSIANAGRAAAARIGPELPEVAAQLARMIQAGRVADPLTRGAGAALVPGMATGAVESAGRALDLAKSGGPAGETSEAATDALISGLFATTAAAHAAAPTPAARNAAAARLEASGEAGLRRTLDATTGQRRAKADRVLPGAIERDVRGSAPKIAETAAARLEEASAALDRAWEQLPEGAALPAEPLIAALRRARDELTLPGAGGERVVEGKPSGLLDAQGRPLAGPARTEPAPRIVPLDARAKVAALDERIAELQQVAGQQGGKIDARTLRAMRQAADQTGRWDRRDASMEDSAKAQAARVSGNAIRGAMAEAFPEVGGAGREVSFWLELQDLAQKPAQDAASKSLLESLAKASTGGGAVGLTLGALTGGAIPVSGGIGGAVAATVALLRSPAGRVMATDAKLRLAKALRTGDRPGALVITRQAEAQGGKRLEALRQDAAKAQAELRSVGVELAGRAGGGIDPIAGYKTLRALARWGAAKYAEGLERDQWHARAVETFGDKVTPFLDRAWALAQRQAREDYLVASEVLGWPEGTALGARFKEATPEQLAALHESVGPELIPEAARLAGVKIESGPHSSSGVYRGQVGRNYSTTVRAATPEQVDAFGGLLAMGADQESVVAFREGRRGRDPEALILKAPAGTDPRAIVAAFQAATETMPELAQLGLTVQATGDGVRAIILPGEGMTREAFADLWRDFKRPRTLAEGVSSALDGGHVRYAFVPIETRWTSPSSVEVADAGPKAASERQHGAGGRHARRVLRPEELAGYRARSAAIWDAAARDAGVEPAAGR